MSHKVGIWIDHKKAVIVSASGDRVTAKTLESDVGPHTRYSGPEDGGGEKKYEDRHGQHVDRYYDEVISQLGEPEAVLIFGPGEAKLQLKEPSSAVSKTCVRTRRHASRSFKNGERAGRCFAITPLAILTDTA